MDNGGAPTSSGDTKMLKQLVTVVALTLLAVPGSHALGPGEDRGVEADTLERVYYDQADAQGNLSGGVVMLPRPDLETLPLGPGAAWITILDNGPSSNRIDIVFVGDGYLASELGSYAIHVSTGLTDLMSQEPFLSYSTFFSHNK